MLNIEQYVRKHFMTTAEIAARMRCSKENVYVLRSRGHLPAPAARIANISLWNREEAIAAIAKYESRRLETGSGRKRRGGPYVEGVTSPAK